METSEEFSESHIEPAARSDWKRFAAFIAGAAVIILAVVMGIALFGNRMPLLTEDELEAAVERWEKSDVRSYVIDLEISGRRAGNVHVEVQNGVVVELNRDGETPRERRTWDVWSVPGQFDMMQQSLDNAKDSAGQLPLNKGTQVVIRAKFDPELGYPIAFSQVTLGGGTEFGWKTVRFERR